jgi:endogenous inhibitor of DNA gyrase (YacG/DUF329 family)
MSPTLVKCPTCRREIEWSSSQFRPFCSERCRLIDLGAWLAEKHAIPGDAPEVEDETPPDDDPRAVSRR